MTQDYSSFVDKRPHRRNFFSAFLSLFLPLIMVAGSVFAQSTTINTTNGSTGYTANNSSGSNSFITFVIENNSGIPIKITEVGNWATTGSNNETSELWYSSTSLSGSVNLSNAAWTMIDNNVVTGVTSSGIFPVLPNLGFVVPDGTTYRFAVYTTGPNTYSGTSSNIPTPNNFTASGVTLYAGNHQIGGSNVGYGGSNNPRFFTGYVTFEPDIIGNNNAGVGELLSPSPGFCAGNFPIRVKVNNSGVNTINTVDINWELDNVAQAGITYNTAIPSGGSADVTLSNSVTFGNAPRKIKAWTTLPNGMVDTVNGNDTLDITVRAGLSGTYTVGGSGADFIDVVDAANALTQYGMCGAVVMDIATGTYTGQVILNTISGLNATNTLTFKSQTGNASDVVINASVSGNAPVVQLNSVSYITVKDVTITSVNANSGRVVEFTGSSSYDSIANCVINSTGTTSSSNTSGIYGIDLTGGNLALINNTINGGYYGIRVEGVGTSNKTPGNVIDGNTINNAYYYSSYFYYTDDLKFTNNVMSAINTPTTHYGIYTRYCDGGLHIINNEITITGSSGTAYGMYNYYDDATSGNPGLIVNNAIAVDFASSTAHGIYSYYSKYQNFLNNSVSVNTTATDSWAGRFYYSSSSYSNNKVFNNAFTNVSGSNYTLYVYRVDYNNEWDYNNIHSGNNKLVERGTPTATYNTLDAWVNAEGQDVHSISYDPGFISTTDLHPNVNNPASWSLNGRALHIAGNTADLDNNARVDTRQAGVPDIGAYEFTPDVMPPVATATPTNADQGQTQVFTFGQREVATIQWGTRAPTGLVEVRQYSGERGVGVVADASPSGTMFFHTDIKNLGNADAYDVDLNVDYMDIWLGNINSEADLRLAHKVPTFSWRIYNGTLSSVDAALNDLNAQSIHRFGSFTGLENGSIPSAFVRPNGRVVFCIGDTLQLQAEPMTGTYYKWYKDGTPIAGAEGPNYSTYTASQAGSYSVAITVAGKVIESVPLPISTVAAPNAVIGASGSLTYCTGNGLTLNAGSTPDVKYQWQLNGQNIPGATNSTYAVQEAGDYTVTVENIGCATASTITPVTAGPLDVSLGNDTTYCEQQNVFATLDAGYPGARYVWNTGDTTQTIEVKQSGDYTVYVDAGPNCIDRDTITVNIDPLPSASGISFVQNGNTYKFFASGLNAVDAYEWIFSDGTTSTDPSPERTISGDLYVRVILYNTCGRDTVQLGWPLTVDNVPAGEDVTIYPNPASNSLNIQLGNATAQQVLIYNGVGAMVKQVGNVNDSKVTIDVSTLAAGNYTIQIGTADGIVTRKFNIVR